MQATVKLPNGIQKKWKSSPINHPHQFVNISPIIGANAGIGAASIALLFD